MEEIAMKVNLESLANGLREGLTSRDLFYFVKELTCGLDERWVHLLMIDLKDYLYELEEA